VTDSSPASARCGCPACIAGAALLLLDTGRPGMARTLLAVLPEAVRVAVAEAYSEGVEHGVEAARKARPGRAASVPFAAAAASTLAREAEQHGLAEQAEQDDRGDDGGRERQGEGHGLQELHDPPPQRFGTRNRPGRGPVPARRGSSAKRSARASPVRRPTASPAPAFRKVAAELAAHVEHLGADRVAAVLGVTLDDLGPLLEGRAAPPARALRRLREASE
jgi:hypothetical protein